MSETFEPTDAQGAVVGILVGLIGLSGVHKRPEQGDCIVLDLLPAAHVLSSLHASVYGPQPFCVKVHPDGRMEMISDEEAGVSR